MKKEGAEGCSGKKKKKKKIEKNGYYRQKINSAKMTTHRKSYLQISNY